MGVIEFSTRIQFSALPLERVEEIAFELNEALLERERSEQIELGPTIQIDADTRAVIVRFTVEGERKGHVFAVGSDTLRYLYGHLDEMPGLEPEIAMGEAGSSGQFALAC